MSTTYDYDNFILEIQANQTEKMQYQHQIRRMYLVTYCIALVLGLILNFIFMIISYKKYKSFKKVSIWILALAGTHFIFCVSVAFQLLYAYHNFEWHYGNVSCKLSSYINFFSMYSTAAMLSLWSVSSTFSKSTCTRRCKNCDLILISFSWSIAAVLAMPSLFSREVQLVHCIDDYDFDDSKTTVDGIAKRKAVAALQFLLGLVLPGFVMFVSCCLASKSFYNTCKNCRMQAQIICAVKIMYFVCWGPQIFLTMIQATVSSLDPSSHTFTYGLPAATALAATHCFTCPLMYILVGHSTKMRWMVHDPDHTDESTGNRRSFFKNNTSA